MWDFGMGSAAYGGHRSLVEFFISRGAEVWNFGMESAALGGQRELVHFFISKGADDLGRDLYHESYQRHQNLIEMLNLD